MKIREKEIDFKISRKSDAENFEKALCEMEKAEKQINTGAVDTTKMSVVIDYIVEMFRSFFVKATGVDVLADCDDMDEAKDAYFAFLEEIKKQKETFLQPFSSSRVR